MPTLSPRLAWRTGILLSGMSGSAAAQLPGGVDTSRYHRVDVVAGPAPTYAVLIVPLRKLNRAQVDPCPSDQAYTEDPDTFNFKTAAVFYQIAPRGRGLRIESSGATAFQIPLDSGFFIERLAYTEHRGDPVFTFQESNGESGASRIARLDSGSMRPRWVLRIGGFNLACPLKVAHFIYVASHAFVGKVDLETAALAWQHADLYRTEGYNFFQVIKVQGDTAFFVGNGGRVLHVNARTGQRYR